ncbi:adenosinetriphosphatase [Cladophialophora psammophila CBS 110553]|uniref:Adenosinetriphosphatase n=1 Tax=Cladophialophora psammophila CBS 110553 TaxID=1182543 RepID=W9X8L3_9EURO|nr:adenosinetriphosphatase [Cladophialophora psammophila CBS 110553]EXJ73670.1 adenosinetriphosphatase [Cladophialophora psammophila CBS 110553]
MLRSKPSSSMQKTYDEAYLQCSTAVFFEGQGNEAEALRSWKAALDQINHYKAYKLSSSYSPRSETERALYDSLRELEIQCKDRVDLLETLKRSREELGIDQRKEEKLEQKNGSGTGNSNGNASGSGSNGRKRLGKNRGSPSITTTPTEQPGSWLGGETIPPMQMSDLPNATPALPPRPPLGVTRSSEAVAIDNTSPISRTRSSPLGAPPTLPVPITKASRSPSPDHGRKTMRTTLRPERRGFMKYRSASNRDRRADTMKAAGLAWESQPRKNSHPTQRPDSDPTIEARLSATAARRSIDQDATARYEDHRKSNASSLLSVPDYLQQHTTRDIPNSSSAPPRPPSSSMNKSMESLKLNPDSAPSLIDLDSEPEKLPPPVPQHAPPTGQLVGKPRARSPIHLPKAPDITYRKEYPVRTHNVPQPLARNILERAYPKVGSGGAASGITRKPVGAADTALKIRGRSPQKRDGHSDSEDETPKRDLDRPRRGRGTRTASANTITPPSTDGESLEEDGLPAEEKRLGNILKNLPKGVDENAAKQILNEIVVKGDEVHWEDVAGLSAAKKALKEAVVYPFLRPDLFMGLREPARGMLLFGPPGTGKTMLARAVATESKSTFFAISASSLTSKWHGESEKLVRALFALAKALAPSIIFVDEIDSLLSARSGSSEHEASRRSKTEFLIQWSDLQRAAAGKDTTVGDASRVLVLAATNCPWDIDDAARRRFVRRQYIPLPEAETRETQIRTLLGHQKHDLSPEDIARLVELTEGYSGSDITALAKDAAMGPLRHLGEALLYTPKEQIRPIQMMDFEASLDSIRPSVSKKGLEEFEKWARDYGERGG